MARQDDISDPNGPYARLLARVEALERANPLANAAITEGGIRVATPEGIRGEAKDSVIIVVVDGLKIAAGGSAKVDAGAKIDVDGEVVAGGAKISAEHGGHLRGGKTSVGSDGVLRNDDGKIVVDDAMEIRGSTRIIGQLDPDSVLMWWGGVRHTVDQVMAWQKADIGAVDERARDAGTSAGSAMARADAAYSLASGKASGSEIASLRSTLNSLIDFAGDLEEYVRSQHPGKVPANPPPKTSG